MLIAGDISSSQMNLVLDQGHRISRQQIQPFDMKIVDTMQMIMVPKPSTMQTIWLESRMLRPSNWMENFREFRQTEHHTI